LHEMLTAHKKLPSFHALAVFCFLSS
jgi:hypothetical protein